MPNAMRFVTDFVIYCGSYLNVYRYLWANFLNHRVSQLFSQYSPHMTLPLKWQRNPCYAAGSANNP